MKIIKLDNPVFTPCIGGEYLFSILDSGGFYHFSECYIISPMNDDEFDYHLSGYNSSSCQFVLKYMDNFNAQNDPVMLFARKLEILYKKDKINRLKNLF